MKPDIDPKSIVTIRIDDERSITFRLDKLVVPPGRTISLDQDYDPEFTGGFKDKAGALERVGSNVERLAEMQEKLYAQDSYALLVILQASDAAGKDGIIRHVVSGVNPQGCHVVSFKAPSSEELDHDYLWRAARALPRRGMIGIFNRSYYEEVLAVRVHPELLSKQKLPETDFGRAFWKRRYKEINNFEKYLTNNGIVVVKLFLNLSKDEQKRRFLDRINNTDKNWKFSVADHAERAHWGKYRRAFEDMLNATSTEWAPWFVVPADSKWFARLTVSEIICTVMDRLNLEFPKLGKERLRELAKVKRQLELE